MVQFRGTVGLRSPVTHELIVEPPRSHSLTGNHTQSNDYPIS
jgi:hypothetical protein